MKNDFVDGSKNGTGKRGDPVNEDELPGIRGRVMKLCCSMTPFFSQLCPTSFSNAVPRIYIAIPTVPHG